MKEYILAAQALEEFIDSVDPEDFEIACDRLTEYRDTFCEVHTTMLWIFTYKKVNQLAEHELLRLLGKLRCRVDESRAIMDQQLELVDIATKEQ